MREDDDNGDNSDSNLFRKSIDRLMRKSNNIHT